MNYVASGYVKTGYVRQDSDTVGNYTFDKYGKFIYVSELATTCDLADVWSRWEDWIIVGDNTKIKPAMKYSGFDPIPTGYTGATFFVYNGWRVIINPAVTAITGVLYSEDYDTGYWTYDDVPLPIYPVTVSAVVNTVTIDGGSSLTTEEHNQLMGLLNTDLTVTDGKIDSVKTDTEQILIDIANTPGTAFTEGDLHEGLDSYVNKDDFKADLSGIDLSTVPADVWAYTTRLVTNTEFDSNIVKVNGVAVSSIDEFKADISNLSADVNVIEVNGIAVTSVDDFKAAEFNGDVNIIEVNSVPVASIEDFKADPTDLTSIPANVWSYVTRELTVAAGLTPAQEATLNTINLNTDSIPLDTWEYSERLLTDNTATVDLSSIPSAVWSHATRTLTSTLGLTALQEEKLDKIILDVSLVPDEVLDKVVTAP